MSIVVAEPARVDVEYTGNFAEPVFSVLGNPANLYTNLLRRLAPFGANARGLNIYLAVLDQANVSCLLASGVVRVWLDRLVVSALNVQTQRDIEQIVKNAWAAMSDTDESLRPIRHTVTLSTWSRLKDESFSSYIQRFVKTPPTLAGWKAAVEFREVGEDAASAGSVHLSEAVNIPEGLFLRAVVDLGPGVPRMDEFMSAFMDRLGAQLKSLDLELPLRVE